MKKVSWIFLSLAASLAACTTPPADAPSPSARAPSAAASHAAAPSVAPSSAPPPKARKTTASVEVNGLRAELWVKTSNPTYHDLAARVTITNVSKAPIRFDARYIDVASLHLDVRTEAGAPQYGLPPPVPQPDDGSGRVVIAAGESRVFEFPHAAGAIGIPPEPGWYQMRFRYPHDYASGNDWRGVIETDWVDFQIEKQSPN